MNLSLHDVYNADECALFYKMLPTKTLVTPEEKQASGYKVPKDRLTMMPCVNVTGTNKIPLQVISKSKNPRCFRNKTLPENLAYTSSKNAWQTETTFKEWFEDVFKTSVTNFCEKNGWEPKDLLLIDNAPPHVRVEQLETENFKIMRLPPNCTSVVQPLDQHCMASMKVFYRKTLLNNILSKDGDFETNLKKTDVYGAIQIALDAYQRLKPSTVIKSWHALLNGYGPYKELCELQTNEEQDNDDNAMLLSTLNNALTENLSEGDFSAWLEGVDEQSHRIYSDREIIDSILGIENVMDEAGGDTLNENDNSYYGKKVNAFNELIDHYIDAGDADAALVLNNLKRRFIETESM